MSVQHFTNTIINHITANTNNNDNYNKKNAPLVFKDYFILKLGVY